MVKRIRSFQLENIWVEITQGNKAIIQNQSLDQTVLLYESSSIPPIQTNIGLLVGSGYGNYYAASGESKVYGKRATGSGSVRVVVIENI